MLGSQGTRIHVVMMGACFLSAVLAWTGGMHRSSAGSRPKEPGAKDDGSVMRREKQDEMFRDMEDQYEKGLKQKYGGGSRGLGT